MVASGETWSGSENTDPTLANCSCMLMYVKQLISLFVPPVTS